jgi:S-adenosylmethionine-dependent methyltransferase
MLSIAQRNAEALGASVAERTSFCRASVEQIPELFAPSRFDLILCHTVLEYLVEPWEAFQAFASVLRPAGLLSLLFANRYADPLRWALARGDLQKARLTLDEPASSADLFGLSRRTFTVEEVQENAARAGIDIVGHQGVRIFADYMPEEKLRDAAFWARLLELEAAAGALFPYRLIARYHHIMGRKVKAG